MSLLYRYFFLFFFMVVVVAGCVSCESTGAFTFSFDFGWSLTKSNHSNSHRSDSLLPDLLVLGDAVASDSAVRLTPPALPSAGRIIYKRPMRFRIHGDVGSGTNPGFSTHFSFSTIPGYGGQLAFFLFPSQDVPPNHHSVLRSGSGIPFPFPPNAISVQLLSLSLSLSSGSNDSTSSANLRIAVGTELVAQSSALSAAELLITNTNEEKLNCLIDYNGSSKRMDVRLSKAADSRMMSSLLSYPIDLSNLLLKHKFFVGISCLSGNSTKSVNIYSWSFSTHHGAPFFMHSEPLDPDSFLARSTEGHPIPERKAEPYYRYVGVVVAAIVFAAACVAFVIWYAFICSNKWEFAYLEDSKKPFEAGYEKILMNEGEGDDVSITHGLELEDLK